MSIKEWHDLRKDKNDLPEVDVDVIVESEDGFHMIGYYTYFEALSEEDVSEYIWVVYTSFSEGGAEGEETSEPICKWAYY